MAFFLLGDVSIGEHFVFSFHQLELSEEWGRFFLKGFKGFLAEEKERIKSFHNIDLVRKYYFMY